MASAAVDLRPFPENPTQSVRQVFQPETWTSTKTNKVALYIIASMLWTGAATLIGLGISGVIGGSAWIALALVILGVGAMCWGCSLIDYENPTELHALRQAAHGQTFRALYQKHGAANLFHYIAQEEGPSFASLRVKFVQEETNLLNILDTYDIRALQAQGFINPEQVRILELCRTQRELILREGFDAEIRLDRLYSHRSERLHQYVRMVDTEGRKMAIENPEQQNTIRATSTTLTMVGHVAAEVAGSQAQLRYDEEMQQVRDIRRQGLEALQGHYAAFAANANL